MKSKPDFEDEHQHAENMVLMMQYAIAKPHESKTQKSASRAFYWSNPHSLMGVDDGGVKLRQTAGLRAER